MVRIWYVWGMLSYSQVCSWYVLRKHTKNIPFNHTFNIPTEYLLHTFECLWITYLKHTFSSYPLHTPYIPKTYLIFHGTKHTWNISMGHTKIIPCILGIPKTYLSYFNFHLNIPKTYHDWYQRPVKAYLKHTYNGMQQMCFQESFRKMWKGPSLTSFQHVLTLRWCTLGKCNSS